MGREVKRVPLDFDWPLNEVWSGFLRPDRFDEMPCPNCERGYSPHAEALFKLWYGDLPFDPATTGSTPLTADTPAVRAFAERNVTRSPEYYGRGEQAIRCEAQRLAELWNGSWSHHLSQDDVDALVAAGRLMDFTHTWNPETRWQKIEPAVVPTAAQVNEWSLYAFGHDGINAGVVIRARCEREGVADTCATCEGHGSIEAYVGQRAEAETWEPTEPPTGDGWQLWETVSEGSPISPVFADAEGLAQWLTTPASCWGAMKRPMTIEQARGFVGARWAPSFIGNAGGLHEGAEFVGSEAVLRGHEEGEGS
jgi:hypothetical protein